MTMHHPRLAALVKCDPRYAYEAYEFVYAALAHTQKKLGRPLPKASGEEAGPEDHVTPYDLLDGIRDLALAEFGLMARTVFRLWGIERTDDFGEVVFNLIDANLMSKTSSDSRADFQGVYDLDEALVHAYRIRLEEVE
jgi:uncharacterized repeat protein (TIGR04138 family)